ncbi:unnamed protein product [Ambrosiozyma monospora]|uniref:Unnamed protein product n=1 Tax=Ambrosiozyma monospora TaxID=43982 RepID=A0ACB5TB74_AMBMO|nr:unnamed protein product [Ambrosiozyma monospora]
MPQRIGSVSSAHKKVTPLPSLYGRLLYEFTAERPDELSVAAGDSVIICAHHEHEWFIGKCLDKIGEPGLIPVSYVQLFDIATKVPYKEPAAVVIEREKLPTVDDWKALKNKHKASARAVGSLALQQNGNGNGNGSLADLSRSSSLATRTQELVDPYATDATVESFASTRGKYWYLVRVLLSNGHVRSLCRYYEDFFNFHQLVLNTWPREGDKKREIPYIPGPVVEVTEKLCHLRMNDFDNYLKRLLELPDYISRSVLVNSFFDIMEGDQEFPDQYAIPSTRITPQRDPPIMSFLNNNNNDQVALQQAQLQRPIPTVTAITTITKGVCDFNG